MKRLALLAALVLAAAIVLGVRAGGVDAEDSAAERPRFAVLVFSKTAGFRHGSIESGVAAVQTLGAAHDFAVTATEDAATFSDAGLAPFDVLLFLNTTGDVFDDAQQAAMERFVRAGGGFAGVHAATDTEYGWPWYNGLVGAYFNGHPPVQPALLRAPDPAHPSTSGLPDPWARTDEWYSFRDVAADLDTLLLLDEGSYSLGATPAMGVHPIAWCHGYDGGRAWYTAMGHTAETYGEPLFLAHLLGGIEWAAGAADTAGEGAPTPRDSGLALTVVPPNPTRGDALFTLTSDSPQHVRVVVFDTLGRRVATLFDGPVGAGAPLALAVERGRLRPGRYVVRATGRRGAVSEPFVVGR